MVVKRETDKKIKNKHVSLPFYILIDQEENVIVESFQLNGLDKKIAELIREKLFWV